MATLQDTVPGQPSPQENNLVCSKEKKRFNCENFSKKIILKPSASFLLINSECFSNSTNQDFVQPSSLWNSTVVESGMLQPDKTLAQTSGDRTTGDANAPNCPRWVMGCRVGLRGTDQSWSGLHKTTKTFQPPVSCQHPTGQASAGSFIRQHDSY